MPSTLSNGIAINEFLTDPNGTTNNFDTDGNGTAATNDEYVELLNTSTASVDIGGLQLWDSGQGNWFTFPANTVIAPGGSAVVVVGVQAGGSLPNVPAGSVALDAGFGSGVLNNTGDNIVVLDPAANGGNGEYIQAVYSGDTVDDPTNYGPAFATAIRAGTVEDAGNHVEGLSVQRAPDGSDTFAVGAPTPGTPNICFVAGTHIMTDRGEVTVENLSPGDLIETLDHGLKPLKWIGKRIVAATGAAAPVRIRAGALGNTRDLLVSQMHRMLLTGWRAEVTFGQSEVLARAVDLLNGDSIHLETGLAEVEYVHILFDRHEIVFAEGAASESFHPTADCIGDMDRATQAEVLALFPELASGDPMTPARPGLSAREAALLLQSVSPLS